MSYKEIVEEVKHLVVKYPNDSELGKMVRKLMNKVN